MGRPYQHIISLGGNCRVAHHLKTVFPETKAFPFDWWISPLVGLVRFLEERDVAKLYCPELLEIIMSGSVRMSVVNTHYDIRLHHEFPRENGDVVADFKDHMAAPLKRTKHLMKRLRLVDSLAPLLFIRSSSGLDPADVSVWDGFVERIVDALENVHGFKNFDLLFINTPLDRNDGRIMSRTFVDEGEDWRGNRVGWQKVLVEIAEHRPQ